MTIVRSAPAGVEVLAEHGRKQTVVWLEGEHDVSTVDDVRRVLALATSFGPDVVVDVSQVEFLDVTTLNAFATAHNRAPTLRLRSPSAFHERMLRACGLDYLMASN
jgi:anti-anti-sigma factor